VKYPPQRRSSLGPTTHLRQAGKASRQVTAPAFSTFPLARPDNIGAAYTANAIRQGRTAKFDGKLKVGAVQLVCTSSHYDLICGFLVSAAQIANGRPTRSVHSTLLEMHSSDELGDSFSEHVDQPRVAHAMNVRLWWEYAGDAVLLELEERKRLQRIFEERYLSFSWSRLTYKRSEYVRLFIAAFLDKNTLKTSLGDLREKTYKLEDELCVEQILLYRSIARSVHVRGGHEFRTILEIQRDRRTSPRAVPIQQHDESKVESDDEEDCALYDEPHSHLAELAARCAVARVRRSTALSDALPNYESFQGKRGTDLEEESLGYASESKTLRTTRSMRSSALDSILGSISSQQLNMLFIFSASVDTLEIVLAQDDESHVNGYSVAHEDTTTSDDASFRSDMLSILTDDKRFEQDGSTQNILIEESESSNRIYSSSDFLLFKVPKKVVARLVVCDVSCESLGRSGDSRNLNVAVGGIALSGEDRVTIFSLGKTAANDVSTLLGEIDVSRTLQIPRASARDYTSKLSISLVENDHHNFVQCDAPTFRCCPDVPTLAKLKNFFESSRFVVPRKLLKPSPYDSLRMFILQQNVKASGSYTNFSVRIQGLEVAVDLLVNHADYDSSSTSATEGTRLDLSCGMIELYSGTAVDDLKESVKDMSASGECSMSPSAHPDHFGFGTRQLGMIDVPLIMATKASPFAVHTVRRKTFRCTLVHSHLQRKLGWRDQWDSAFADA
jgi:hypothetical protein